MKQLFFLLCFILAPLCASAWQVIGSGEGQSTATIFTDDFNRADGALGSNWAQAGTWPMPGITSNQVKGADAGSQFARYIGANLNAAQQSSVTITDVSNSVAPCVRIQDDSNSGYCAKQINVLSYFVIIKIQDGEESVLGLVWDTVENGAVIGIKASGSTITATKNGVDYTSYAVVDATYGDGDTGIWCWGAFATADNFSTGNL